MWRQSRKVALEKLKDPSLKTIRLYDPRHYFATMLYHKTKDILYVMKMMEHKKIEITLLYTQLVNFSEDEYSRSTAKTPSEAAKLIGAGFEYVCSHDDTMLFRKRK